VDAHTAAELIAINRQFYQRLASEFSGTRRRLQPGALHIIETIPTQARILDLGCGNGNLALHLARRGFAGSYTGMDFSPELLHEARMPNLPDAAFDFQIADLSQPGWESILGRSKFQPPFDCVLAFAVLHHLPGSDLRRQVVSTIHSLLGPSALFVFSVWQFLSSPRLRQRILPWESAGLSPYDVDPGDYLLDWRSGGYGLRYVHHFEVTELEALAAQTGFSRVDSFLRDGENHRLGLYQVWTPDGSK
jgi:SAM-dependent methyltransferase